VKYIAAFLIGFVAVLLVNGFISIGIAVFILLRENMTARQLVFALAVIGGLVFVIVLRWLDPPKTL
jgi:hypothetical protein